MFALLSSAVLAQIAPSSYEAPLHVVNYKESYIVKERGGTENCLVAYNFELEFNKAPFDTEIRDLSTNAWQPKTFSFTGTIDIYDENDLRLEISEESANSVIILKNKNERMCQNVAAVELKYGQGDGQWAQYLQHVKNTHDFKYFIMRACASVGGVKYKKPSLFDFDYPTWKRGFDLADDRFGSLGIHKEATIRIEIEVYASSTYAGDVDDSTAITHGIGEKIVINDRTIDHNNVYTPGGQLHWQCANTPNFIGASVIVVFVSVLVVCGIAGCVACAACYRRRRGKCLAFTDYMLFNCTCCCNCLRALSCLDCCGCFDSTVLETRGGATNASLERSPNFVTTGWPIAPGRSSRASSSSRASRRLGVDDEAIIEMARRDLELDLHETASSKV